MSDKRIVAVVGMPGSGKGTCTDYLAEKYGWPIIHFGNMVYEEVQRRGLHNVNDEKFVREDMRAKEGKDVLAKHALKKAKEFFEQGASVVIFDGLYSWSEYKYLANELGDDLTLITTVSQKALRRQRVLDRNDSHRKYNLEELIAREIAEIENLEKGGPIAYADHTILNNGSAEELLATLESILKDANLT